MNQEKQNAKWLIGIYISLGVFVTLSAISIIIAIAQLAMGNPGGQSVMGLSVIIWILILALRNELLHSQLRNKIEEKQKNND